MKVRYTLPAAADLESVLDYVAKRSPQGARRVHRRIESILALASAFPYAGTLTDDPTVRRMLARPYPYLIFYEVSGEEIIVHAIRHASRHSDSMPGAEDAPD